MTSPDKAELRRGLLIFTGVTLAALGLIDLLVLGSTYFLEPVGETIKQVGIVMLALDFLAFSAAFFVTGQDKMVAQLFGEQEN